jgi:hypothetical protein
MNAGVMVPATNARTYRTGCLFLHHLQLRQIAMQIAMNDWKPIESVPTGRIVLFWEPDYGWVIGCKSKLLGLQVRSTGNFWGNVPPGVKITYWHSLPFPPEIETRDKRVVTQQEAMNELIGWPCCNVCRTMLEKIAPGRYKCVACDLSTKPAPTSGDGHG